MALPLLGVRVAPRHQARAFGEPRIGLAQHDASLVRKRAQLFDRRQEKPRVGPVRDILRHHCRIDRDAGEIIGLQRAGAMRDAQALGEEPVELVADPAPPVAQIRALMRKGVLEKLFAGEVLEIGIIDPALAGRLVGKVEDVLQQQKPDHEPGRNRRPAVPGERARKLVVDKVPVDRRPEPNQFVAHVDDLIEARAEQILLARAFLLSRPHRVTSDATRESRVGRRRKAKTLIPNRKLSRSPDPIPAKAITSIARKTPATSANIALFTDDYQGARMKIDPRIRRISVGARSRLPALHVSVPIHAA